VAAHANAILECWYPGQEGGTAMAEALFGVVNPGAKLPVTVARDAGHVPFFYNHKPSARRGYLFADPEPLFPFGHGLSYTEFEIGEPRLSATRIAVGESVEVAVEVRNLGSRSGDEVVQVYLRDEVASVTQPVRALRAFRRVTLEPGQCETLRFRLQPSAFRIWNDRMVEVIEPGRFTIGVGPNSVDLKFTTLDILECGA
jgi:beta-glucosidase